MNEINFNTLQDNFDQICDTVNENKEAVTLTLKSNRKVYIMPEEGYDSIKTFFFTSIPTKKLV